MNDVALKNLMLEILKRATLTEKGAGPANIDPVTIDDIKTQKRAGDKDQDLFDIDLIYMQPLPIERPDREFSIHQPAFTAIRVGVPHF